jgi:hypothetical protein
LAFAGSCQLGVGAVSVSSSVGALNPDPRSIFGRIVSGADVEDWCIELLKAWTSTYLSEVERQHGLPGMHYARPRSYVRTISFDQWPEDQLPRIVMASAGQAVPPRKNGDGTFRCWWVMGFGIVCSTRYQQESHEMALNYVAAVRTLFIQRPSLGGNANGVVWLDERYDDLTYDDTRSLSSGQAHFTVEVDNVASAGAGPTKPDVPSDDPWPYWPIAETVDEQVISYGTEPLPRQEET